MTVKEIIVNLNSKYKKAKEHEGIIISAWEFNEDITIIHKLGNNYFLIKYKESSIPYSAELAVIEKNFL